jgi:DNA-binding protein Fis
VDSPINILNYSGWFLFMENKKKRTEEQLKYLRELCGEFSLRELVDEKIDQILVQMESLDGDTYAKGDIYRCVMGAVEDSLITKTMSKTKGNKTRTANLLGMNRNTLRNKINS